MDKFINKVICADCLVAMKDIPDKSIDMILTSPPYDNLRDYKGYTFNFEGIAKEIYRVLKDGGVCVWVVGDATIKGSETGTSFKQALYFKEIGFNLHDTMIYRKTNPIPLTHNRYEQHFEYMFVFSKGKPKTFNPILEQCKTSGAYTHRRNTGRAVESSTRNRDEVTITKSTKYKGNIFEYVIGSKKGETGNHTAPFPEKLAEDHILSWSNEGDIILDPMAGSGTTLKMAKKNNRNYIGIEISPEYIDIINKRLNPPSLVGDKGKEYMNCPINKKHKIIMIEYGYGDPYRYDGISEIQCNDCGKRYGRWTGKILEDGDREPPFGEIKDN